ncbi:hypothetical protein AB0F73_00685 [Micromonospora purpureochromogenes]|uniref:hypothetical protein n=1 Tax=Micromonospora purpureochromogenes TaxID=47872 RepID=UPI0033C2BD88
MLDVRQTVNMRPEIVIAIMSAAVSLVSGVVTAVAAYRTTVVAHRLQEKTHERTKSELAEELFRRYREPLLWSAQALQSRLYNGISQGFLARYLRCGNAEDERYVVDNTVYVLAEYLGWLELLRRDQRFLDVTAIRSTRDLFAIVGQTQHALATDGLDGPFRLFRGQQRAIGELMLKGTESTSGPTHEVLGYAAFCARLDENPSFRAWFDRLRSEVPAIESAGHEGNRRLIRLQDTLVELVHLLDPNDLRLPQKQKSQLRADNPERIPQALRAPRTRLNKW